jgi:hypothetical protein
MLTVYRALGRLAAMIDFTPLMRAANLPCACCAHGTASAFSAGFNGLWSTFITATIPSDSTAIYGGLFVSDVQCARRSAWPSIICSSGTPATLAT